MSITFGFFHDAALTQPIDSLSPLFATQDGGASLGPVIKSVWLGSPATGTVLEVSSDPGVDPVVVSIFDSTGPATGADASHVKLAIDVGSLASATPGAPLVLAATLPSGVANAVQFVIRVDSPLTVPGLYSDLAIRVENPYEHS